MKKEGLKLIHSKPLSYLRNGLYHLISNFMFSVFCESKSISNTTPLKIFPNFKELKFSRFFALRKYNCLNEVSFVFLAKNMLNFKHFQ
jgi:hypothetical protein